MDKSTMIQFEALYKRLASAKGSYEQALVFNTWNKTPEELCRNDLALHLAHRDIAKIECEIMQLLDSIENSKECIA